MPLDEAVLLAGLEAAGGEEREAFEPSDVDPDERMALLEELQARGWVTVAHPLRGEDRLTAARGVMLTPAGVAARRDLRATSREARTEAPDPAVVWAALRAQAERDPALADEAERALADLANRGMVHSGISVRRARDIAAGYALTWDDDADTFVEEHLLPPSLDGEQRLVVEATGREFDSTDDWPALQGVVRSLLRAGDTTDPEGAAYSLPPTVGFPISGRLVLRAEGLAASGSASGVLGVLVRFARHAADVYLSEQDPPLVSGDSVQRSLELDDAASRRLRLLLRTEPFFFGSGHSSREAWEYELATAAARFRDCRTIAQYLLIRRALTAPIPGADVSAPVERPGDLPTTPPGAGISGLADLHPEVVAASASLFGDGHYAQAVFEAFKSLETRVREQSGLDLSGRALMAAALSDERPHIDLRSSEGQAGRDEQEGFRLLFMGATQGIRNPRAHMSLIQDTTERAFEYLALASLLFRRLDDARDTG